MSWIPPDLSTPLEPGISVIIPHYGEPDRPAELAAALLDQRTEIPLQIVIVDDASPAPAPAVRGTELVAREHNGGFGSAVNTGAGRARHELLLILNSDLEIEPGFIDHLLDAADPWMPAVVSPRVVGHDGAPTWSGRHFPRARHQFVEWLTPLARFRDRTRLHEWVGHDTAALAGGSTTVDWVVGAALLLPTADFRAVGGFDERFFMNSEEVDLQRRLRDRGLPSVLLGEPTVVHEGGGSSDPARRRGWLVRSRLAYADKWGSRRPLQAALASATVVNLLWNTGRRVLGRPVRPIETARAELALLTRETDR